MYVGNILIVIGVSLASNSLVTLLLALPLDGSCYIGRHRRATKATAPEHTHVLLILLRVVLRVLLRVRLLLEERAACISAGGAMVVPLYRSITASKGFSRQVAVTSHPFKARAV